MWFDKLTTNEIKYLPFALSLSKDLFRTSFTVIQDSADNTMFQRTVRSPVRFQGLGLHTAGHHEICIKPASVNFGVIFRKFAEDGSFEDIHASWKNTKDLPLCTCISNDQVSHVRTIEHLMAALYACEIDNALIEVQGSEVPILDGSALPFVEAILQVGVEEQSAPRRVHVIEKTFNVTEANRFIKIEPGDDEGLYLDLKISLAKIGTLRWAGIMSPQIFRDEMAGARTFGRLRNGFLAKLTRFKKDPICLGANTRSALVIVGDKVINRGGLRMPDEYVRHRVLDLMGDLMLAGCHFQGKITAESTAHRLNHQLLQQIFSEQR